MSKLSEEQIWELCKIEDNLYSDLQCVFSELKEYYSAKERLQGDIDSALDCFYELGKASANHRERGKRFSKFVDSLNLIEDDLDSHNKTIKKLKKMLDSFCVDVCEEEED